MNSPQPSAPQWQQLATHHDAKLVEELRRRFERGGWIELSPVDIARVARTAAVAEDRVRALLDALTPTWLTVDVRWSCGQGGCRKPLTEEQCEDPAAECPYCGTAFVDEPCIDAAYYVGIDPGQVIDVSWVLLLHGMNTRGGWQEQLSWLIARTYGTMVPVAAYKYGVLRSGALLRWRHRYLCDQLAERLRIYSDQARIAGYTQPPTVVAHSFGTLLLGRVLEHPEHADLHGNDPHIVAGQQQQRRSRITAVDRAIVK